jgi:hypothetical protein
MLPDPQARQDLLACLAKSESRSSTEQNQRPLGRPRKRGIERAIERLDASDATPSTAGEVQQIARTEPQVLIDQRPRRMDIFLLYGPDRSSGPSARPRPGLPAAYR